MQLLPTLLTTLIALQGPPAPAKKPQAPIWLKPLMEQALKSGAASTGNRREADLDLSATFAYYGIKAEAKACLDHAKKLNSGGAGDWNYYIPRELGLRVMNERPDSVIRAIRGTFGDGPEAESPRSEAYFWAGIYSGMKGDADGVVSIVRASEGSSMQVNTIISSSIHLMDRNDRSGVVKALNLIPAGGLDRFTTSDFYRMVIRCGQKDDVLGAIASETDLKEKLTQQKAIVHALAKMSLKKELLAIVDGTKDNETKAEAYYALSSISLRMRNLKEASSYIAKGDIFATLAPKSQSYLDRIALRVEVEVDQAAAMKRLKRMPDDYQMPAGLATIAGWQLSKGDVKGAQATLSARPKFLPQAVALMFVSQMTKGSPKQSG
jgi:hypothetical protein